MSTKEWVMQDLPQQTIRCAIKHQRTGMVPGYELLEAIGEGGFSLVYRAKQLSTGQVVAVKVLRTVDAGQQSCSVLNLARFEREVRLCAALQHPHIVKLLDKGETLDKELFAVFEYVPGQTLKQRIKNQGAMTALEAAGIMGQVLDALVCAHKQGIVHRDLKPQNIMLTTTGANTQAKILDFGIGTIIPRSRPEDFLNLTQAQDTLGTPAYCAPEQLRGEPAGIQTDLYAWGLVFLECLIAEPVMQGASVAEIFHKQLSTQEVPIPPAIIDHPLAAILRRALKKKPYERCNNAESLWRDMRDIHLADIVGHVQPQHRMSLAGNEATLVNSSAFKEKRQITVLCCSVSVIPGLDGALVKDSDIETLEIVQQDQFNQCKDIATRYGGELAGCLADRMLVYFGYPHASDTDARRAARTALEIIRMTQDRSQQLAEKNGLQLHSRIGMHTGLMLINHAEAPQGYVALIAMRLESEAQVGSILASEASYKCLEKLINFEPDTLCCLSGQYLALQTYRLIGPRKTDARDFLPIPDSEHQFVGNQQQLEWLKQKWRGTTTCAGGQGVLIRGEAGIGKSRLIMEMFYFVQKQGHDCYVCRCLPEHQNNGLFPFLELIQQILNISKSTPPEEALDRLEFEFSQAGCGVERILPIIGVWLGLPVSRYQIVHISPQLQKAWLLQALIDWLIHKSKGRALLLIVEDLHWADPTSEELLKQLLKQLPGKTLQLLMSARPEFKSLSGNNAGEFEILQVNRLSPSNTEELIKKLMINKKPHPDVINKIVNSTDGVPLFIEELTQMLLDKHLLEDNGYWRLKNNIDLMDIPLTLRDLLIGRLDSLAGAKKTAQIAASIGREFDYELLANVIILHKSSKELNGDLSALLESGLIYKLKQEHKNAYSFRHSLIRDAAYEAMLNDTRQQTHGQIALVMSSNFPERLKNHPGEVAEHYSLGGMPEKSSEYFIKAARLAASMYSNQEAFNFYTKAISEIYKVMQPESDNKPARSQDCTQTYNMWQNINAEAHEGLGDSAALMGDHSHARQAFNMALNIISNSTLNAVTQDNNETNARLLRKLAKSWEISHEHKKSLLLYQQAEQSLGEFSSVVENNRLLSEWLKINSGKLYVNYWDNNNSAMQKILAVVQPVIKQRGDRRQQAALILDELLFTYRQTGYKLGDQTVQRAYELVDLAKQCHEPELLAEASHELGLSLLFSRRYTESVSVLKTALKLSKDMDNVVLQCRNLTYLTVTHRLLGKVEEVARMAQTTLEVAERIAMTDYIAAAKSNLAWVAWRKANYNDAYLLARQGVKLWQSLHNLYPYPLQWLGLLVLMAISIENDEVIDEVMLEYIEILLSDNQQILPENMRQHLFNAKDGSVSYLKEAIKVAESAGML